MSKNSLIAHFMNQIQSEVIYKRYKNIALNMFEWNGLPKGITGEIIEKTLYSYGKALFFNDKNLGYLCLPCSAEGFNVYDEPINFRAFGHNYTGYYNVDNSVLIKNNMLMANTHDVIATFTQKLIEIERTLDVNVSAQKTPYMIASDSKNILTMKNIVDKIQRNELVIYHEKGLDLNGIQVLELNAPFICDKLSDYETVVENRLLTFLGINNANTDKRERLNQDEVNSNNDYIEFNAMYMLETRKKACEEINNMFPELSVSVKRKEVEESGRLYNDDKGDNGKQN